MWAGGHQVGVPEAPCTLLLGTLPLSPASIFKSLTTTTFEDRIQTTIPCTRRTHLRLPLRWGFRASPLQDGLLSTPSSPFSKALPCGSCPLCFPTDNPRTFVTAVNL